MNTFLLFKLSVLRHRYSGKSREKSTISGGDILDSKKIFSSIVFMWNRPKNLCYYNSHRHLLAAYELRHLRSQENAIKLFRNIIPEYNNIINISWEMVLVYFKLWLVIWNRWLFQFKTEQKKLHLLIVWLLYY